MKRYLVVPQVAAEPGQGPPGAWVPKYVVDLGIDYDTMTYGRDNTYLLVADFTTEQHAAVASNLDVISIPAGLDNNVTLGALPLVQNALESLRIPGGWVTTGHTYRQVVSLVGKLFKLMQYFSGQYARSFWEAGITLDTRRNQLTQAQRNALEAAALHFGASPVGVTGTTTVRQILKIFGDQMAGFTLGGEAF